MSGTSIASADSSSSDDEENSAGVGLTIHRDPSQAIPTSSKARAKWHIAALEDELEVMRQERGGKQRKTTFYVSQGRAIRRLVVLYHSLEDLVAENDRRYEFRSAPESTPEQNRLQRGYIELARVLPWLHEKLGELDHEDSEDMLRKLKKGADAARGDDTSTLKELVAAWVNQEFRPSPLIQPHDKYSRGFASDICGRLLCPAEWDWNEDNVKAGIRDRTTEYIVSENSWPLFVYENYQVNSNDLEEGFLKSRLLVLAFKAVFTSPSSAREIDGDGDGADIIENNRRARRRSDQTKVKTFVSHFPVSHLGAPWTETSTTRRFGAISWTFFEDVPGPVTRRKVEKLLEWWTRKIFGTNHREDLTPELVSHMSVNALAEQRKKLEDAAFDSD
ncbi:hypothetical protein EDD22DRAFT_958493 [Suillus occidentalis]|nr:hypothetical protein EDD22DRAFT_958493 [Suillus occidentalis]